MLISRIRYNIETYFQWKTNRESYVACQMAPVLSVSDLKWPRRSFDGFRPFQVQSVEHLYSIVPDFYWHRARAVPRRQLSFLFSSACHCPRIDIKNECWKIHIKIDNCLFIAIVRAIRRRQALNERDVRYIVTSSRFTFSYTLLTSIIPALVIWLRHVAAS